MYELGGYFCERVMWHIVLNLVVIKNSLPHSSQLFSFIVNF